MSALSFWADWHDQPRLWGHQLHRMCSYLGSFPPALVHTFISRYSRAGDLVVDPFCGRGTVPLQACVEGRFAIGNDLNPLAALLTFAKVTRFDAREVRVESGFCGLDGRKPGSSGRPSARLLATPMYKTGLFQVLLVATDHEARTSASRGSYRSSLKLPRLVSSSPCGHSSTRTTRSIAFCSRHSPESFTVAGQVS